MRMTKKEAIEYFKMKVSAREAIGNDIGTDYEANKIALSALRPVSREQVERMRGEWRLTEYPFMGECEDCSVCGYRTAWGHGFRFCPRCGAPMTDEAVEMVMERVEALKDDSTTD